MAGMVKLAADLCVNSTLAGNVLIKEIKIYGALLDIHKNVATPASLQICFNKETILRIGHDQIDITECMFRISKMLS